MAGKGSKPGERKGGRQKGTPNKIHAATRERIEREADPIGFLIAISNGQQVEAADPNEAENKRTKPIKVYATLEQRIQASNILTKKLLPDLKAIEHSPGEGAGRFKFLMDIG